MQEFIVTSVLVLSFVVALGLAVYLLGNAKSHAAPRRFFIGALLLIFIAYGIKLANDYRNASTKELEALATEYKQKADELEDQARAEGTANQKSDQKKIGEWRQKSTQLIEAAKKLRSVMAHQDHIADLVQLVAGAFAGALASAAITNRAKFQHDAVVLREMRDHYEGISFKADELSQDIRVLISESHADPCRYDAIAGKNMRLIALVDQMSLISAELTRRELESLKIR